MDGSRAWDSAIPERWNVAVREILQFLSDGRLPGVGFCIVGEGGGSRQGIPEFLRDGMLPRRDSAILGRWNVAAREIRRFLSGGWFLRVEFCDSRAVDGSYA